MSNEHQANTNDNTRGELTFDMWYQMNHDDWKDLVDEHNALLAELKEKNKHQANDQYMMEHGCLLRYLKDKNDVLLSNDESLSACRFLWWMQDSSPEDIAEVMTDGYHWAFHKPVPVLDIVKAHTNLEDEEE